MIGMIRDIGIAISRRLQGLEPFNLALAEKIVVAHPGITKEGFIVTGVVLKALGKPNTVTAEVANATADLKNTAMRAKQNLGIVQEKLNRLPSQTAAQIKAIETMAAKREKDFGGEIAEIKQMIQLANDRVNELGKLNDIFG